jgi:hypothetical protein
MKSALNTLVVVLVLAALPAWGGNSMAIEDSHELDASMVTLPATNNGSLIVQGCSACPRTTYTLSPETRFYLTNHEVTFVEFKRYLDAKREAAVFLVHTPKLNVVTRLVAQ